MTKTNAKGRVLGIGGIFFHARDPKALIAWYKTHLGLDIADWGGTAFKWRDTANSGLDCATIWSVSGETNDYFKPSTSRFMINYLVDDVRALLARLKAEGCAVDDKIEDSEYGIFGWVMDPEGNKLELWQPPILKS